MISESFCSPVVSVSNATNSKSVLDRYSLTRLSSSKVSTTISVCSILFLFFLVPNPVDYRDSPGFCSLVLSADLICDRLIVVKRSHLISSHLAQPLGVWIKQERIAKVLFNLVLPDVF